MSDRGGSTRLLIAGASLALLAATIVGCSDAEYVDPNDVTENVAAMEALRAYSWVKDLYVSPGHMNVGVIAGEKEWGAPMITSAVCAKLAASGSGLSRVRFVDIRQVAAGRTPRQAEIITVDCPEPTGLLAAGSSRDSASAAPIAPDSTEAAGEAFDYDVIAEDHNNAVENYHLAIRFSADQATLSRFAREFTASKCRKPCNLFLYDEAVPAGLVTKYPLRGAEYVRVADHLIASQSFNAPGELWMWPLKDWFYDETKAALGSGR